MILSLTCSSPVGSVSIADGERVLKTLSWKSERSHAEYVSLKIAEITGNLLGKVSALAVDVGPGSFTGIRIGVNTIKTLSYALAIPVVTGTSLEILAEQGSSRELPIVCMIDAFSKSAYVSTYKFEGKKCIETSAPHVVKSAELKNLFASPCLCIGDAFEKYSADLKPVKSNLIFDTNLSNVPTSEILTKIANSKIAKSSFTSWQNLEPLYIRRSSAEEKLLV